MSESPIRFIDNGVPPERERLSDEDVAAIRERCLVEIETGLERLVQACPPRAPRRRVWPGGRDPTLYLGLLGHAYGLLHMAERGAGGESLVLAGRYLGAARDALARSSYPRPEEWLSFHGTGGIAAIGAVLHDRLGDAAERDRQLDDYHRLLTAAARDFPSEDLLWGRGGALFGAAWLRDRLGPASVPLDRVQPVLAAMIDTGRRLALEHQRHLTPGSHGRTPLLYLNLNAGLLASILRAVVPGPRAVSQGIAWALAQANVHLRERDLLGRYDIGMAHGLPGCLYRLLHFPELLDADRGWRDDVEQALDCLLDCVDGEGGMRALLPSPRSDAIEAKTPPPRESGWVHWCRGSPAGAFLFARAHAVFGKPGYLHAATRLGDHVWRYGLLRKGNGLCHGVAGNAYALLAIARETGDERELHRALHFAQHSWSERVVKQQATPDRPWSLYEGLMGTLCFYRDCLDPARARFPAFEV